MPHPDSEVALEQATVDSLAHLGWQTVHGFDEVFGGTPATPSRPNLGRENTGAVVLIARLLDALQRLNPALPAEALQLAIDELTRDRRRLSPAEANREAYRLLKDGVRVTVREGEDADERIEIVRVVDWSRNDPAEIVARVARIEQEAQAADLCWPRWTPVLWEEIAKRVSSPSQWTRAIIEGHGFGEWAYPFLHQACEANAPDWVELATRCLDRPQTQYAAIATVLKVPGLVM